MTGKALVRQDGQDLRGEIDSLCARRSRALCIWSSDGAEDYEIDEYVEASGAGSPDREDLALLSRYLHRNAGSSCLVGCGDCLSSCPAGVAISDVMRTRMYALDYQQPAIAADEYDRLERNAASCLSCSGAPCASACPSGLDIASLARDTHTRLTRDTHTRLTRA